MDRIWNIYGLDNRSPLSGQAIADFYQHPVWLMNGIFTQLDPESAQHRRAIAKYLRDASIHNLADYGGGFGELALAITETDRNTKVSIIEPYPSHAGLERIKDKCCIQFQSGLSGECFEAIIAQDVLEHVEDPIELAWQIAGSVQENGLVIFANCYHPFILCHLPRTFHLRHSFRWIMRTMGLKYIGVVDGAPHAQIFKRKGALFLRRARFFETCSRLLGPAINRIFGSLSRIRQRLDKT